MSGRDFLFDYFPKGSIGCEVGVWRGDFSQELLDNVRPSKLYLIDPWKARNDYKRRWYSTDNVTQKQLDMLFQYVQHRFKDYSSVVFLRDISSKAFTYILPHSLDWVYIDGDHSESEVYKDLVDSYEKLKVYGYITGDDYLWLEPITQTLSVKQAVARFLEEYKSLVGLVEIKEQQYVIRKLK